MNEDTDGSVTDGTATDGPATDTPATDGVEHPDAVVVGGGPAGCAASLFLARYGLDTVVFDSGTASLDRCAFLGNYPGFPAGIDVDTFQTLLTDQIRESEATLVAELVERIDRPGDGEVNEPDHTDPESSERFRVETADGRVVTAEYVLAATRYGGEYLRPLGGATMFETHEHDGEEHEHFDPDYPDADGRTPIDGLYIASPAGQRDAQAVVAAGRGGNVARALLEDHRIAAGYPSDLAIHYDWLRPETEFEGAWADRDRWREWFDDRVPDDCETDDDRLAELREQYIDDAFATRRTEEDVADLTDRAHRRLVEHVDDDIVLERAAQIRTERSGSTAATERTATADDPNRNK